MKTKIFLIHLAVLCLALWRLPAAGVTAGHCFVAESATGIIYDYATNGSRIIYATNTGQPYGLAFDKSNNLFVADRGDGKIYKISPVGSNSVFAVPYNGPAGLAVDSSNNLFVGESGNGYIFDYAPDGTPSTFGQEPCFDDYYNYGRPDGLTFSPSGVLYATDEYYGYLYQGVPNSPFTSVTGDPWGLAFDSRSNLFVAAFAAGKIYKMVNLGGIPGSAYTTFATNLVEPTGLAFDSNDNLFVADYSAGKIYKFDPNGVQTTFASGLSSPIAVTFPPVTPPAVPPPLVVSFTGNSVLVSWKNSGAYTLEQNGNLANPNGWTTNGDTITTANGTNSITINPSAGNRFFRLSNP